MTSYTNLNQQLTVGQGDFFGIPKIDTSFLDELGTQNAQAQASPTYSNADSMAPAQTAPPPAQPTQPPPPRQLAPGQEVQPGGAIKQPAQKSGPDFLQAFSKGMDKVTSIAKKVKQAQKAAKQAEQSAKKVQQDLRASQQQSPQQQQQQQQPASQGLSTAAWIGIGVGGTAVVSLLAVALLRPEWLGLA